jgi:hypothetical protein
MVALAIAGVALALCPPSAPAFAHAMRTWVSGVGDDANPCSRTAPSTSSAAVISTSVTYGEIDALDPGGFGAPTTTKSITTNGRGGQVSVSIVGTNGIVENAGLANAARALALVGRLVPDVRLNTLVLTIRLMTGASTSWNNILDRRAEAIG